MPVSMNGRSMPSSVVSRTSSIEMPSTNCTRSGWTPAVPLYDPFCGSGTIAIEAGQVDQARAALDWLVSNSKDEAYRSVARLRLAGIDIDAGQFDAALRTLEAPFPAAFDAMAADRRGDALLAKGDAAGAKAQFEKAWAGFSADTEYRRLVEVKLASLGVDKSPAASQEGRSS